MEDEAGSHTRLEEVLKEWAAERDMLSTGSPADVAWTDADASALALLATLE